MLVNILQGKEVIAYMKHFLQAHVKIYEDVWQEREADPAWKASSERAWSIDALQQYLMQQKTLARKTNFWNGTRAVAMNGPVVQNVRNEY